MSYFYVICPVGTDPSFRFKRAVLEDMGAGRSLRPFFPLEHDPDICTSRLIDHIQGSIFVIADISFERPSCYFELGLAEALDVPLFLLANVGTRIHQVGDQPVKFYADLEQYRQVVEQIFCSDLVTPQK